jgi:hypothetical protein
MRARVSDAEFSRKTATDSFDHVELRSSVVVTIRDLAFGGSTNENRVFVVEM